MRWFGSNTTKYYNKKVSVNGKVFDSKKEALRYCELIRMECAGLITDLVTQPTFELQPKFKKNGKTVRAITYTADFMYKETQHGCTVVEDVKGMKTHEYVLKKKMFEYKFPNLTIVEI